MKIAVIAVLGALIAVGASQASVPSVLETGGQVRLALGTPKPPANSSIVNSLDSQAHSPRGYHVWHLDFMTESDGGLAIYVPRRPPES